MTIYTLDTETTGLNDGLALDVPIQLALVRVADGVTLINDLIKTDQPIPDHVVKLTGIDPVEHRYKGTPWDDVLSTLRAFLGDRDTVYCWNAPYDLRIMVNACYINRTDQLPPVDWADAMTDYQRTVGLGYRPKLTGAYEQQFGSDSYLLKSAHDAEADAHMTAQLVRLMLTDQVKQPKDFPSVILTDVAVNMTKTATPTYYLTFRSVGGQTVNIFQSRSPNLYRVDSDLSFPDYVAMVRSGAVEVGQWIPCPKWTARLDVTGPYTEVLWGTAVKIDG